MIKKDLKEKRTPILIAMVLILSIFIGIIGFVVGSDNIENYNHPYLFEIIVGGIGIALGIKTSLKLKPFIAVNQKLKTGYSIPVMFISAGFLGVFLLTGSLVNRKLSKVEDSVKYTVIDKYMSRGTLHTPGIISLNVIINGESQRLNCSRRYWDNVYIGQSIKLCYHTSPLGFDYISLVGDEK